MDKGRDEKKSQWVQRGSIREKREDNDEQTSKREEKTENCRTAQVCALRKDKKKEKAEKTEEFGLGQEDVSYPTIGRQTSGGKFTSWPQTSEWKGKRGC